MAVLYLNKGEEVALSGTANQIISIYDHFDVKLIPAGKDVLGKVEITDGSGSGNVATIGGASPNFGSGVVITDPTTSARVKTSLVQPASGTVGLVVTWNTGNTVLAKPLATPKEAENFLASVAANTAETVEVTGTVTLGAGTRVFYTLASARITLTTPANDLAYVALKSHTGGVYMAIAFLGQAISGAFDLEQTTDTIDIVVRNQDTVAHSFGAAWQALTP